MPMTQTTRTVAAIAAAWLLLLPAAYAQTTSPSAGNLPAAATKPKASGAHDMASMQSGDMKKSMDDMSRQMASMPMTGDPDRDFATMMRIHHQGAIDMAQAELATGKDPQMRKLAKEIIAAQKKEIALIDRWLKKAKDR